MDTLHADRAGFVLLEPVTGWEISIVDGSWLRLCPTCADNGKGVAEMTDADDLEREQAEQIGYRRGVMAVERAVQQILVEAPAPYRTPPERICGMVLPNACPDGASVACAWKPGHLPTPHSWASLPTYVLDAGGSMSTDGEGRSVKIARRLRETNVQPLPRPCRLSTGQPKVRYETRAEAKAVARTVPDMRVYRCPNCRFFHLGHATEPEASRAENDRD